MNKKLLGIAFVMSLTNLAHASEVQTDRVLNELTSLFRAAKVPTKKDLKIGESWHCYLRTAQDGNTGSAVENYTFDFQDFENILRNKNAGYFYAFRMTPFYDGITLIVDYMFDPQNGLVGQSGKGSTLRQSTIRVLPDGRLINELSMVNVYKEDNGVMTPEYEEWSFGASAKPITGSKMIALSYRMCSTK